MLHSIVRPLAIVLIATLLNSRAAEIRALCDRRVPGFLELARISVIALTLLMVVTTCLQTRMYMRVGLGIRDVLLSLYSNKHIPMT